MGALLIAIAAVFVSAQNSVAADRVSLRLSYTPFAAHIPVYVAKAKGYYEAAGLDVDILSGRGSVFAATTVGAGKEEFGISDAASVVTARAKGVPVIAIGNLQQDNGAALIATEKSGIAKVDDLKGRNIGILPGSTTTIFLQALLKQHGMSMDDFKAVTWRPGTDLPLLLAGKIDAEVTVYNNEVVAWGIEHPELKLKVWTMASLGFDTPGYALITSEEYAARNPKIVSAFANATFKGTDYALKNPEEAVDILVKAAPELKKEVEAAKWQATIGPTQSAVTKRDGLGAIDRAKWENLNDLLKTYAVIDNKVDLGKVLKDEYRR
jgi:ABC-type nitrate/sulfonate/bicarbonate transport system substrate-binding protein